MRKFLRASVLALFVLCAVSLQAQTIYKWRIDTPPTPNADLLTYTLHYSLTTDGTTFFAQTPVTTLSASPPDDINSATVRFLDNEVNYRNKVEAQKAKQQSTDVSILVGKQDDVKPAVIALQPKPPAPTQKELDQQAFSVLWTTYLNTKVAESAGFPTSPKAADILTQLQTTYKPEYLPMLGGRGF